MCITLCLSLNFCLSFFSSKCCTLGIMRFFSSCFLLTVVSAILSNIILSKIIVIFPFTPVPDLFLSIVNKQIPILDLCGTPQMTLIHLRSDNLFPVLYWIIYPCVTCLDCLRASQFLQVMRNLVKRILAIAGNRYQPDL